MVNVVGYCYNADTFCVDCTIDYVKEKNPSLDRFEEIMVFEFKDEEGNNIHPIFDIDEALNDLICGNIEYHREEDNEPYIIQECNYVDQDIFDEIFDKDSFYRVRITYIDGRLCIYYGISEYIQSLENRYGYDLWFNSGFLYRKVMDELAIIIPEHDFNWYIESNRLIVEISVLKETVV